MINQLSVTHTKGESDDTDDTKSVFSNHMINVGEANYPYNYVSLKPMLTRSLFSLNSQ